MNYSELIGNIKGADPVSYRECRKAWDAVAKPLNSLGLFEELTARIAGAQRCCPPHLDKVRALIFCADNGVVEEGVSQSGQEVTCAVAESIAKGQSNINLMASCADIEVEAWDVGMAFDSSDSGVIVRKCANGTKNLSRQPAMTENEAVFAINTGIAAAEKAHSEGCDAIIIGEMGIGNTTTSAAILSIMLGLSPQIVTGRGSGLSDEGLKKKISAIERCIEINKPDISSPLDVLAKAGGFDIAAMCGVMLAGAELGIPVILDGLITMAAAVTACSMEPKVNDILIPSHCSREPGASKAMEYIGLRAPIMADMALGEGTGGAALVPLLRMSLNVLNGGHSFDSLGMEAYTPQN